MIKEKQRKRVLILCLILSVFFMNLPVIYTKYYHEFTNAPKAFNGTINLSAENLSHEIYLDGQWEFYWNRLIETDSEQLPKPDMIIDVPDSWSNYVIDGKSLSASGFGSYKLTLTGLEYDHPVALYIPDFGGAYRVFIDGQLAAQSGTVSKDNHMIFTVPKAALYPVMLSSESTHTAVIEVATTRFSGLYMVPVLRDYNQVVNENSIRNAVRFILFGIALFSLLSLIAMYTLSVRRKLHSFWLPVMIFFILMRIMLTTEFYSIWQPLLFFNLCYESTNELMYFSTFMLKYLLIFLVQEQCGIQFTKKEKIGFLVYYILLYLTYLFTPQSIYNHYLSVVVPMLTYVLDFFLFVKIYRDRDTMKKYGMAIFWSAILVITGLTIESYYINGKIYMNMSLVVLLLFTVFALIMAWVYAMRVGDLYDDFSKSSSRLELANSQITIQKEYFDALSSQMNEIREIKHDIRHFIGTMSRLAEEDLYEELKGFLREYSEKTEMEQLPVFCENIVANSIIGYYYLRAKEYGITFESKCNIPRQSVMSDSDLCIVLGNALENAVYACKQMERHNRIYISIEAGILKKQNLVKIRNTYNGSCEVRDNHLISTKNGKSHGFGLRNIERVIASYGGIVKIEYDEKEFTLMASVPEK